MLINSVTIQQEVQADIFDNMIVNAAGDPISGVMVERNEEEIVWNFTTNLVDWEGIDAAFGSLGRGCVNSDDFVIQFNGAPRTFPAGTLRFMSYSMSMTLDASGEVYTRMSYRTHWRPEGWLRMIANKGLRVRPAVSRIPIKDEEGNIVTTPQYLTADGTDTVLNVDGEDGLVNFVKCPLTNTDPGVTLYQEVDLGTILFWDLNT